MNVSLMWQKFRIFNELRNSYALETNGGSAIETKVEEEI